MLGKPAKYLTTIFTQYVFLLKCAPSKQTANKAVGDICSCNFSLSS